MRKVLAVIFVVGLLVVAPVGLARADFIGEFCWNKSPFSDIVKLAITARGAEFEAHGSQGTTSYTLPAAGNAFIVGSQAILGLTFTGNRTSFGGSVALAEYVPLSLPSLSGTGVLVGIDGRFSPSSSTWIPISCPAGPANVSDVGAAEGAQGK